MPSGFFLVKQGSSCSPSLEIGKTVSEAQNLTTALVLHYASLSVVVMSLILALWSLRRPAASFFFFTLTHSTITAYSNGWVLHSEFLWESFFHVTGNVVQVYNPGEGFFYSSCNGNITIFYNAVMKKFFFFQCLQSIVIQRQSLVIF